MDCYLIDEEPSCYDSVENVNSNSNSCKRFWEEATSVFYCDRKTQYPQAVLLVI
jgi:hypothetical protein